ncbi:2-succinyl-5-enolpyruvyl-6-hydroxy-3-cyclohexene-1-carboxylic-acid synthase, partial [Phytoactinopolyspora endophytica]|uniref:2-succinyl-5-enolpyruvyl-6-hydroxy-3- cyclohexene-1-carboxylic-acid synthase n=1 Tax=Phytoactinopolyspora endophytica TaxID=1642495 RepID=UPI003B835145
MGGVSPSTAVADVLVAELVRQRVRHVVLAPGSRSAPLAFAVMAAAQRGELGLHVRIDERVAAFTALGLAKATGPVAIVTTSGTAVANLHPAVLEASHSGVPLVVLTADRPHEMRGTGANQTTDQVRIFGNAVRFFVDVPAPHGRAGEDADARNLLGRALAAATGVRSGDPGPVHLNLSFREPLVPDAADTGVRSAGAAAEADQPGSPQPRGASQVREVRAAVTPEDAGRRVWAPADAHVLAPGVETVVIAGDGAGQAARQCAEAGGFPLLAEP